MYFNKTVVFVNHEYVHMTRTYFEIYTVGNKKGKRVKGELSSDIIIHFMNNLLLEMLDNMILRMQTTNQSCLRFTLVFKE